MICTSHSGTRRKQSESCDSIVCRSATAKIDIARACGLVYEAYVRSGLMERNPYNIRVTPYHLLDTTEIFLAEIASENVTTMTLVRDGELGVPMDSVFPDEVAQRRDLGTYFAEVSCLADRHPAHKTTFAAVIKTMSLMAQSAKHQGVDELLIAVHPRHARFYIRFIGFEQVGSERSYGAVRGRPAVPLALDLNLFHINHPAAYKRFFRKPFADDELRYHRVTAEAQTYLREVVDRTSSTDQRVAVNAILGDQTGSMRDLRLPAPRPTLVRVAS